MLKFSAKWRPRSPKSNALKAVSTCRPNPSSRITCLMPSSACLEYRKVVQNKQKMVEKKSENEMVMAEFKMLDDDANVFKMVGPILAK